MAKIRLHPIARIEMACSEDPDYPELNSVHYNAERGRLEATNGFILAIQPLPPEGTLPEESGLIDRCAIEATRDEGGDAEVELDSKEHRMFPLTDALLGRNPIDEYDTEPLMVIDARLLLRLAKAICQDKYRTIAVFAKKGRESSDPFLVVPITGPFSWPRGWGLIGAIYSAGQREHLLKALKAIQDGTG